MPAAFRPTLHVNGYRQFVGACIRAQPETKAAVKSALKAVAEPVRADAAQRFSVIDARSAAGFRVVVRTRGIAVEQSIKRTTGLHPEYGALQMTRALLPARADQKERIEQEFERALDVVVAHFNR